LRSLEPYRFYHCYPALDETREPFTLEDFYERSEVDKINGELAALLQRFGGYQLGAIHLAPCPSWRAERPQLDQPSLTRFATRCHVFQCTRLEPGDDQEDAQDGRHGRYLGFVSLRPSGFQPKQESSYHFTAVANLVLPSYMQRPRYHIITSVGGTADGVLPFRCSPFCVPNPGLGDKATCLYVALYQGLLLKMYQFGLTPVNSADMRTLFWQAHRRNYPHAEPADTGATLLDALEVLRNPEVGAGGVIETFQAGSFLAGAVASASIENAADNRRSERLAKTEALRCLTDYLANGLPVVVQYPYYVEESADADPERRDHAMLVLGMHLMQHPTERNQTDLNEQIMPALGVHRSELPGRLVCHDADQGAYHELPTAEFLAHTWLPDVNPERSGIDFLAIAPRGTVAGIGAVRRAAQTHAATLAAKTIERYFKDMLGVQPREIPWPTLALWMPRLTRLLKPWQLLRRYCQTAGPGDGAEARVHPDIAAIVTRLSTVHGYWWAVEIRLDMHEPDGEIRPLPTDAIAMCHPLVYFWRIDDAPEQDSGLLPLRGYLRYLGKAGKATEVEMVLRDDNNQWFRRTYVNQPTRT
jgi:hypothetical protein